MAMETVEREVTVLMVHDDDDGKTMASRPTGDEMEVNDTIMHQQLDDKCDSRQRFDLSSPPNDLQKMVDMVMYESSRR